MGSANVTHGMVFLAAVLGLSGCAHHRFATTADEARLERHKFVADVTCTNVDIHYYKILCDEFHMLAMPPRIRWTVAFGVDHVIKGEFTNNCFRLSDARNQASPFASVWNFGFETKTSYRVGFNRIKRGEVSGLEILTKNTTNSEPELRPIPSNLAAAQQHCYDVVTNAITRKDWNTLRGLVKPGMRANEYIGMWENYERAGHPVRVGKLISVEKDPEHSQDGRPCKMYSFALENEDGNPNPHWLQILVREEGGRSEILDFWNFGW